MAFLRNRFLPVFFLVLFSHSFCAPYYALALTSGPHQPEYTSYEDAGSTDMVNLLTGDFNFNVPVIEVPSPEGNFSLPLSYHAGIGLEQEASWVGLGWNINAGAILRDVNQYPDDALGESNFVTVQDLPGLSGWNRTFNHPFRDDWNSQTGYHGNINLLDIIEVDFGSMTSVGIVGVHVGDGGVTFDPVQFSMAAMNIVSYGMASGATSAMSIAKQAAIDLAISTAVSFAMPINTPGSPASGNWRYSKSSGPASFEAHHKAMAIHWAITSIPIPIFSRKKSYKIYLDQTRTEEMFGVLNLGEANSRLVNSSNNTVQINSGQQQQLKRFPDDPSNRGVGSDINFTVDNTKLYPQHNSPNVLATDSYTVNAPGVSGSISPYRLDIGSLSMPRQMSEFHQRLAPIPYLNSYKVPFIYENSPFNQYLHHVGKVGDVPNSPQYNYGLNVSGTIITLPPLAELSNFNFTLNDEIFEQRIQPEISSQIRKKIPQGNDIEWLSNSEIRPTNGSTKIPPSGFIDFLSADAPEGGDFTQSDRYKFRSHYTLGLNSIGYRYPTYSPNFTFYVPISQANVLSQLQVSTTIQLGIIEAATGMSGEYSTTITGKDGTGIFVDNVAGLQPFENKAVDMTVPYSNNTVAQLQQGIGGYSITAADGATYHFAIPVYDYDQQSESISLTHSNKRSIIRRISPFANTWLLTAITGPDFIDRNMNGLADDQDWGYWVKMNYGKHSDTFGWRIPYENELTDATGTFKSYERGKKQLYYLNSIETRSHVALFMKSAREDSKSTDGTIAPLKLDEICLLKKEQYKKLLSSPYSISDFSNKISAVCLSSSFLNVDLRNFINMNCLKRVKFTYGYDLCQNTPNASGPNNPNKGKLTLKKISVYGRNNFKTVPDSRFEYNTSNPDYNANDWDGWGMYNANGTTAPSSHTTTDPAGSDGSAWSLSKVITPLGAEIDITYERDTYSSISGEQVYGTVILTNLTMSNAGTGPLNYLDVPSNTPVQALVGKQVQISGIATYTCPNESSPTSTAIPTGTIRTVNSIQSIGNGHRITFDQSFFDPDCSTSGPLAITINGSVAHGSKKGGNIRVAAIELTDPNGRTNKQRYLYHETDLGSSGVVAQEPDYIKTSHYDFYDYLKFPQTPVMYGKVAVLSGKLANDLDYDSKQVFEFETPHKSQLTIEAKDEDNNQGDRIDKNLFKIEDRTAKIGKTKSVRIYDRNDNLVSESALSYTDRMINDDGKQYQGVFSEGTLLMDFSVASDGESLYGSLKANRTTVLTFPYVLKKVSNIKDGFVSTTENLRWDLITGTVTEKLSKSSLGIYVKTVTEPAYKYYPELGSKAFNNAVTDNKNMLIQNAATYVYRTDPMGNPLGLISADAQTWRKDWVNYRQISGGVYEDEGTQSEQVWRKGPAYVWKGDITRHQEAYGTQDFDGSDQFNFGGSVNTDVWQYVGEAARFDHFGMPLESVDKDGIYAAVKMGYDNRTIVASASNAKYKEIAFSSAEDKIPGEQYFGGEVALGSGTLVSTPVHTGHAALSVSSGYGFVFYSDDLTPSKRYRASVWANSSNGRIYYKLNNGSEVVPEQTISQAVAIPGNGSWYRIDMTFENPSPSIIEIGVKANSGTVVFDDFRFQPADAVMTCYVYPPLDFEFTIPPTEYSPAFSYSLDNDNLFTKVESNEKGEVVKVYAESLTYGVKLISESKTHYRRSTTDPQ